MAADLVPRKGIWFQRYLHSLSGTCGISILEIPQAGLIIISQIVFQPCNIILLSQIVTGTVLARRRWWEGWEKSLLVTTGNDTGLEHPRGCKPVNVWRSKSIGICKESLRLLAAWILAPWAAQGSNRIIKRLVVPSVWRWSDRGVCDPSIAPTDPLIIRSRPNSQLGIYTQPLRLIRDIVVSSEMSFPWYFL